MEEVRIYFLLGDLFEFVDVAKKLSEAHLLLTEPLINLFPLLALLHSQTFKFFVVSVDLESLHHAEQARTFDHVL